MFLLSLRCQRLMLAGCLSLAALYMLFLEPWGQDTWYHLQRLMDVRDQFSWIHPRAYFADNAAQGRGLPVWIYYSQWAYWPATGLASLGVSPLTALKLVYGAFMLLCGYGCHRLLRLHAGLDAATLGTVLFVTANFVIGEVFVRSAYAEFLSVAWLPLLLVALHRTVTTDDRWAGVSLALLAALMVIAHPLSFMNSAIAMAAYAAFVARTCDVPLARLLRVALVLLLSLGLTAFFWLPAVVETRHVLGAQGVPTPLRDTFLSTWNYVNFSGITNLGAVLTLLTPAAAASLLRRRGVATSVMKASWTLLAGLAVYLFFTVRVSEPVYEAVPLLTSNLWAWRVLFQMSLLATLFVVVNLPALPAWLRGERALCVLAAVGVLQAAAVVAWNTAGDLSLRRVSLSEILAGVAVEKDTAEGFGIQEYLPNPRSFPRSPVACAAGRTVAPQSPYDIRVELAPSDAGNCIRIPRYWNVRYAATIAGEAVPVYGDAGGEIVLVPGGRSGLLHVQFTRPAYVQLATALSLGSAALLLLGMAGIRRRSKP